MPVALPESAKTTAIEELKAFIRVEQDSRQIKQAACDRADSSKMRSRQESVCGNNRFLTVNPTTQMYSRFTLIVQGGSGSLTLQLKPVS